MSSINKTNFLETKNSHQTFQSHKKLHKYKLYCYIMLKNQKNKNCLHKKLILSQNQFLKC